MKVYIDLLLIVNFMIDLILLLSVAIILKRRVKYERIMFGSFIGSFSILCLFFNISNTFLFIIKVLISILMIIITFKFKNIKYFFNNILFLYINSIMLGGFIYFINVNFLKKTFFNSYFINFILLLFLSPIIIIIYLKNISKLKNNYNNYYKVDIYLNKNNYHFIGYIDSANTLLYHNYPVIIINENKINFNGNYKIIPYQALNYIGFLKIIKIDKLIINNSIINNCYLGLSNNNIKIDGVDVLLNNKIGGLI